MVGPTVREGAVRVCWWSVPVLSPGGEEGPGTRLVHPLLTQEKRAFLRIRSSTVTSLSIGFFLSF